MVPPQGIAIIARPDPCRWASNAGGISATVEYDRLVSPVRDAGRACGFLPDGRPSPAGDAADVRAVRVGADVTLAIRPAELDIVVDRLALRDEERFDLVVATNVFVYYAPFEQALAAANIAAMLKAGGLLLSNTDVPVVAPMRSAVGHLPVRYSLRRHDDIFVYQRED